MMKKYNKILGLGVAVCGVAASIGASYALYTKTDSAVNIGIGAYAPTTDAFVYRISDISSVKGDVTPGTSGYTKTDTLSFTLGGQYPSGSTVVSQLYYVGYLTVDIYNETAVATDKYITDVIDSVTPSLSYVTSPSENCWWTNTLTKDTGPAAGHIIYKGHVAFATGTTNTINASVALGLNFESDDEAITYGNQTYNVKVTFEEADEDNGFNWLYIRGDTLTGWEASTDYRLVPNLGSGADIEYMYVGLAKTGGIGPMKIANKDWSVAAGTADGKNFTPSKTDESYDVYWHGANTVTGLKLEESSSSGKNYINTKPIS